MPFAEPTIQVVASAPPPRSFYQRHHQWLRSRTAQLLVAVCMAATLTLAMWWWLPALTHFWTIALTQMLHALAPESATLVSSTSDLPAWTHLEGIAITLPVAPADFEVLGWHLGGALVVFVAAGLLRMPFRTPLRLLACCHVVGVLGSLWEPDNLLYSVESHTRALALFSQGMLLILPIVMAFTHYIVERSNERRVVATVLIALYLIAAAPIKLLAHALLIQASSGLSEPTLFLIGGPALDIFAVTALYAWAVTWRHNHV